MGRARHVPGHPGNADPHREHTTFDRIRIALPAGRFIRISAPGASGIDGRPTDQTFLPESIIRTGGDLTFTLSAVPGKLWGTAESSAPTSFGRGNSALTINVSPAIVAIAPGSARTVTVNVQRMIDGSADYAITGSSYSSGAIAVAPVSGRFAADGSASQSATITAAKSVLDGYYPVVLTTTAGEGARTFTLIVAVGRAGLE
ncbi:hypothetical protein MBOT_06200 [Mycobacterium botniense]|uniref:Uncharacterized protein n=1 Tax=Mycobacterium botniense TaxID=84962 RepID=A0A7I9XTJ9_9MYCO|nr:hypothetical protein MBOT_06200 [Mycobacterium botniense]